MVVGFTTTCAITAYHHYNREFEPRSWRGVLDTSLYDIVCQWLLPGRWFISASTPISSTNKTDRHNIIEILMKLAFTTKNQTKPIFMDNGLTDAQITNLSYIMESIHNFYFPSNFDYFVFLWLDCDEGFSEYSSGFPLSVIVFGLNLIAVNW